MRHSIGFRTWLVVVCTLLTFQLETAAEGHKSGDFGLCPFTADITPPLGHPCMGGGIAPAQRIDDPLFANGFVLLGAGKPIVLVALDWCEVRNDAYERWRQALAAAAGTEPVRVLVTSLHQHDAPIADLEAQRLLDKAGAKGKICDLIFHEQAVQRVAVALRESLKNPQKVTHLGVGQAKVENVGSNRRYLGPDGKPRFNRMSATRDATIREQPEGIIDPWLKTMSFWSGDRSVLALSAYATHPMSYYGKGGISADFIGLARQRRQADDPQVKQIYLTGCSGNVTAGKFNDGSIENRPVLAEKIYQGMVAAGKATTKVPLKQIEFRSTPLRLKARDSTGFTEAELAKRVKEDPRPFGQCLAALGLSWQKRVLAEVPIDVSVVDFGSAQLLLLPAEAYVEFQLRSQEQNPDSFVLVMGYGECGPGYIPPDRAFEEKDGNLSDWCWVAPGSEEKMMEAIRKVLPGVRKR